MNLSNKHKHLMSVAFLLFIILLMTVPIGNGNINNTFVVGLRADYIIHCILFLPWLWIGQMMFAQKLKHLLWSIIGIITVVALESIQILLPYRGFNINDIIAGIIGILLSYTFFKLIQKFKC